MADRLLFVDAESAADAATFAARAARLLDPEVRLRADGGVLAMTAAALAPQGWGDAAPTVLALRTLAVDPELVCDLVVAAAALVVDPADPTALLLPDTALAPAWAGVSPPRGGWAEGTALGSAALAAHAEAGIAEVARAVPAQAGEDVVRAVRARVWGATEPGLDDLPRGVAFAASALGLLGGPARVFRSGAWTRISLRRGHVLVRGPVASGLTPVRATGMPR